MPKTIYRILGIKGRTTIPFEIRKEIGFRYNDILSFTAEGDTLIIKREKLCTNCRECEPDTSSKAITLEQYLDGLSPDEQRNALVFLSVKWAQSQEKHKV